MSLERKHEVKFLMHDVEKEELEKFLKDHPEFGSEDTLMRVGIFEYIYAYKEGVKHITQECIKLIGG